MEGKRAFQILIGTGALLVLFGAWLLFSKEWTLAPETEIARVEISSGTVFLIRDHQRKLISRIQSIQHLDRIETGKLAQVIIRTPQDDTLRLFEDAAVVFDHQKNGLKVLLQHGEIIVENISERSQTYLIYQGEKLSLADYQSGGFKQKIPSMRSSKENENKISTNSSELSQEALHSFIQKNRVQFFKCYSSLLQKDSTAKGEVQLTLTILKNGKITQPTILQNFTEDKEFSTCLLQVLSRTEIPAFQGEPVTTIIPLVFE